jgi:hypothetical protein
MTDSEIARLSSQYCNFCDGVIEEFRVSIFKYPERRIGLRIRCRNASGAAALVSIETKGVRGWSFSSAPNEAGEVVSEGIRFRRWNDLWLIDFEDSEIPLASPDWRKDAKGYVLAQDVEILEAW